MVTSNGDSIYKCPLCKENLQSQKDFTTHIRGHNEVKPHPDPNDPSGQAKVYYCCLCGKMLSSFSSLDRHMLVHSGERPFSCELCGQTFTTNGNMHRHKRTHSAKELQEYGEAMGIPLASLGKRGGRKKKAVNNSVQPKETEASQTEISPVASAKSDIDDVKKPHCPICSQSFLTTHQLEAHLHSSHAGEELKCQYCGFTSLNFGMLQIHMILHSTSSAAGSSSSAPSSTNVSSLLSSPTFTNSPFKNDFSPHKFPQLCKAMLAKDEYPTLSLPDMTPATFGKPLSAFVEQQRIVTTTSLPYTPVLRSQLVTDLSREQQAVDDNEDVEVDHSALSTVHRNQTEDLEHTTNNSPSKPFEDNGNNHLDHNNHDDDESHKEVAESENNLTKQQNATLLLENTN